MPKTLLEKIVFTVVMAAIMVYGMIVYNVALAHVRAGYLVPHRVQYLHQRKHAAAADADKVDMLFSV